MRNVKLKHVRKYDDGNAKDGSFTLGSATLSDESGRLVGDLALLTRPFGDTDSAVDFDEIERLASEGVEIVKSRLDWMIDKLGIVEAPSGELHWVAWSGDMNSRVRRPTRDEILNLEGESRLLYDGIDYKNCGYKHAVRILAAHGVACVERALDAETRMHMGTVIEMYSAAGVLLGHANYFLGCITGSEAWDGSYREAMRNRGRKRWDDDPKAKAMSLIRAEWEKKNRPGASFARDMARMFQKQGIDISEGGVKNAISRWRKET